LELIVVMDDDDGILPPKLDHLAAASRGHVNNTMNIGRPVLERLYRRRLQRYIALAFSPEVKTV
jgi:hypothetical protein